MLSRYEIEEAKDLLFDFPDVFTIGIIEGSHKFLQSLVKEASEIDMLDMRSLKLIVIAAEFPESVYHWQRELNEREHVTMTTEGIAMGKAMTWKNEKNEISSVVIYDARLFLALLRNDTYSKAVFFHEFAHVDDVSKKLLDTGYTNPTWEDELAPILRFISDSVWAEYFANRKSSRHMRHQDFELERYHSDIIEAQFNNLEEERKRYRIDADMDRFWAICINNIALCASTIGRMLGSFYENEKSLPEHSFVKNFKFSPEWRDITQDLRIILSEIFLMGWSLDGISKIEPLIMRMLEASCVIPRPLTEGGLYINVPDTPRDNDVRSLTRN